MPYPELGTIARQIGYDGVDVTVMEGGHVNPRITNVDLVRAFESVRGAGLEVPMITTTITSINDQTSYAILAITGHTQVHLYRLGFWPYTPGLDCERTEPTGPLCPMEKPLDIPLPPGPGAQRYRRLCCRSAGATR